MHKSLALVLVALLAGCATSVTPNYDLRFGDAVREAKQRQTANPAAGANLELAYGMEGKSAGEAVGRYHESFKAPPPVVNVINIGGAVSGGGGSR